MTLSNGDWLPILFVWATSLSVIALILIYRRAELAEGWRVIRMHTWRRD
jgi:hypothetical protein